MRAIRYREWCGPEGYELVNVPTPMAGAGQVVVALDALALNPVDVKSSRGTNRNSPDSLPAIVGCDFAGTVVTVGAGVEQERLGGHVYGQARHRAGAEFIAVDITSVLRQRPELGHVTSASLPIPARTACASVRSLGVGTGDTVFVSAAVGSVGIIAAQLCVRLGARVVGSASVHNHALLRELGIEPIDYGGRLEETLRATSPSGFDAVLDFHGDESVEAALSIGVSPSRINSVCAYRAIEQYRIRSVGGSSGTMADIDHVAELIAAGRLRLPRARVFPFERYRDAYRLLLDGHGTGKIILVTGRVEGNS